MSDSSTADRWDTAEGWERDEILHHSFMKGGPLNGAHYDDFDKSWDEAKVYFSYDGQRGRIIFNNTPFTFILQDLPQ